MKILLLDIETSPNQVFTWGLFKQTISIDKIIDSSALLCWSAKWLGEPTMFHHSIITGSKKRMLLEIHRLLDLADAVIHYNGSSFDIPVLNKEFVLVEMQPPSPYKQIDLCLVVQRKFRFPSSKLDYVCGALKIGHKTPHEGFKLWIKCIARDLPAWKVMTRYNKQDVVILEKLYERLKPWISGHPNRTSFDDRECCPTCGSENFQRRGTQIATIYKYQQYQCRDCGAWFRGTKSVRCERKRSFTGVKT